jgi:hypothetical protein
VLLVQSSIRLCISNDAERILNNTQGKKVKKSRSIIFTTVLLIVFFAGYTYLDRAKLYENIGEIILATNLAAYLLPALVLWRSWGLGNSFARTFVKVLTPSLTSIPLFVCLVCVFNLLTVPNFLDNIPLYQFIFLASLMQLAYALTAAVIATALLKIFVRISPAEK